MVNKSPRLKSIEFQLKQATGWSMKNEYEDAARVLEALDIMELLAIYEWVETAKLINLVPSHLLPRIDCIRKIVDIVNPIEGE